MYSAEDLWLVVDVFRLRLELHAVLGWTATYVNGSDERKTMAGTPREAVELMVSALEADNVVEKDWIQKAR